MIARDTGHIYVDETEFHVSDVELLWRRFREEPGVRHVVQAPGLCHIIHNVASDDIAIILMRRDVDDIIRSQKRIRWRAEDEASERRKYGELSSRPIAVIKYAQWEWQKLLIRHYVEIEYESLSRHPLWVPKEERKDFAWAQWQVSRH